MISARVVGLVVPVLFLPLCEAAAQEPGNAGSILEIGPLHEAAIANDPRSSQFQLLAMQSDLRLENIAAGNLPSVRVEGRTEYRSDVPETPFQLPGGVPIFSPPKATVDTSVRVEQSVFDPTRRPQAALERAQLAEQQSRVRVALFTLRQQVNDAFFAAALVEEHAEAMAAAIREFEVRLEETAARVREGAALPADAAVIEATLLERRQEELGLRADRRAALARLGRLTGEPIDERDTLALPDLADRVAEARRAPDLWRARPEYKQFARMRERLARQQDAAAAQERPRLSTFARLGYGRPGLNFVGDEFDAYGVGGIQLEWRAWNWGSASRDREALALQQQVVSSDEAAFTKSLGEAIEVDLAAIDRLQAALTLDDRIVALREQVERVAGVRFGEGVVTAAEYVDRSTELLEARLSRAAHEVELAQASARLLTTLGLEVR